MLAHERQQLRRRPVVRELGGVLAGVRQERLRPHNNLASITAYSFGQAGATMARAAQLGGPASTRQRLRGGESADAEARTSSRSLPMPRRWQLSCT